jgi:hypothetical protein
MPNANVSVSPAQSAKDEARGLFMVDLPSGEIVTARLFSDF